MSGKKKKKDKKVSAKKLKYAKFKKDKPSNMNLTMPDLSADEQKQKLTDEKSIDQFLKFSRNKPTKTLMERLRGKKTQK